MKYRVLIEQDEDGFFVAEAPSLPGCISQGDTRQEAQNNALGNLSRIFQSSVQADQKLIEDFTEYSSDTEQSSERITQMLSVTRIGSNQDLMNSKVLEMTRSGTTYYALAGMNRFETSRIYSAEISNNELKITDLERRAGEESDKLRTLGMIRTALMLARVNNNLIKQKRIIDGMSQGMDENAATVSRLQEQFYEIKSSIGVNVNAEGVPEELVSALNNAFEETGFTVDSDEAPTVLKADIRFEAERADLNRDNAEFARWNLLITLRDVESNRELSAFQADGREGALNYDGAMARAKSKAGRAIESDFPRFLNQKLLTQQ